MRLVTWMINHHCSGDGFCANWMQLFSSAYYLHLIPHRTHKLRYIPNILSSSNTKWYSCPISESHDFESLLYLDMLIRTVFSNGENRCGFYTGQATQESSSLGFLIIHHRSKAWIEVLVFHSYTKLVFSLCKSVFDNY